MELLAYIFLQALLLCLFLVVTFPIPILGLLLFLYLEPREDLGWLKVIAALVGLVYLLGLRWFASHVAQRMAFGYENFWPALKEVFSDLRFKLAFLPLVGHWFQYKNKVTEEEPPVKTHKCP